KLPFSVQLACDTPQKARVMYRHVGLPQHMGRILERLRKDERAFIFLNKVSKRDAPDYSTVIKHPMDLGTVGRKLALYRDIHEFKKDLDLIWSNCLLYNTAEYFVNCATHMRALADRLVDGAVDMHPGSLMCANPRLADTASGRTQLSAFVGKFLQQNRIGLHSQALLSVLTDALEYRICDYLGGLADSSR
ncbi:hypothetical protein PAPHI01_2835, partial [Pancytospora philotis]